MEYQSGGDEHGKLYWPGNQPLTEGFPSLGQTLKLQPGHCDPTFNMYDWVSVWDGWSEDSQTSQQEVYVTSSSDQ